MTVQGMLLPGQEIRRGGVVVRSSCPMSWRWPKTWRPSAVTSQLLPNCCWRPNDICWNKGWWESGPTAMMPTPPCLMRAGEGGGDGGASGGEDSRWPPGGAKQKLRSGGGDAGEECSSIRRIGLW